MGEAIVGVGSKPAPQRVPSAPARVRLPATDACSAFKICSGRDSMSAKGSSSAAPLLHALQGERSFWLAKHGRYPHAGTLARFWQPACKLGRYTSGTMRDFRSAIPSTSWSTRAAARAASASLAPAGVPYRPCRRARYRRMACVCTRSTSPSRYLRRACGHTGTQRWSLQERHSVLRVGVTWPRCLVG